MNTPQAENEAFLDVMQSNNMDQVVKRRPEITLPVVVSGFIALAGIAPRTFQQMTMDRKDIN